MVRGIGFLHVELRRWADILVTAPLSTKSTAKMTARLADSLLLSMLPAQDTTGESKGSRKKRIILSNEYSHVKASRYEEANPGAGRKSGR